MFYTVIAMGALGRDAELRYTPKGTPVAEFSMAVTDGYGETEKTTWLRCYYYGKRVENLVPVLKRGTKVAIEGKFMSEADGTPRVYRRQNKTYAASYEISVQTLRLISNKAEAAVAVKLTPPDEDAQQISLI